LNRAQKLSKVGQPVYRVKVDRSGKKAVAPVLVKKSYQWQTDLFNRMVEGVRTDQIPHHKYPVEEEDNLKKEQEFSKIDAIANLQKRLMK